MKQQADALRIQSETLGMSVGKAAEYTAVQTRLADALRAKQTLTETDISAIKRQAAALGEAAQAAERARIGDQIKFGGRNFTSQPRGRHDRAAAQGFISGRRHRL